MSALREQIQLALRADPVLLLYAEEEEEEEATTYPSAVTGNFRLLQLDWMSNRMYRVAFEFQM